MIRPTHHYIGRCKRCKAVLSSVYDMIDFPRDTADAVQVMLRAGLQIERVPLGSVQFANDLYCECIKATIGLPLFEQEPS